jgi:hypothetical protein
MGFMRDIERIVVLLRARHGDSTERAKLFDVLQVDPQLPFTKMMPNSCDGSPGVILLDVSFGGCLPEDDNDEEFGQADSVFGDEVERRLVGAAAWLDSQPAETFDKCREQGFDLSILIEIELQQLLGIQSPCFDLELPWQFLHACGKARLPVLIDQEG